MIGYVTHVSGYYEAKIKFFPFKFYSSYTCYFCREMFVHHRGYRDLIMCQDDRGERAYDLKTNYYCPLCFTRKYNLIYREIIAGVQKFFDVLESVYVNKSLFECYIFPSLPS